MQKELTISLTEHEADLIFYGLTARHSLLMTAIRQLGNSHPQSKENHAECREIEDLMKRFEDTRANARAGLSPQLR